MGVQAEERVMKISDNQYKNDIFQKLNFNFNVGLKLLDVGCGDGSDAEIFAKYYGLDVFGIDVHNATVKSRDFKFVRASIYQIPYPSNSFDYVFLHDVLHHIDEPLQRESFHEIGLKEVRRVCKNQGVIIIVEANRYNPLFFLHMTLLNKHNHFTQKYFIKLIKKVFVDDFIQFKFYETHFYPKSCVKIFKFYENLMEKIQFLRSFLAYNVCIIKINKKGV